MHKFEYKLGLLINSPFPEKGQGFSLQKLFKFRPAQRFSSYENVFFFT